MLRREYGKAIQHIRSGINIYAEHFKKANGKSSSQIVSNEQLEIMLRHLETHLCELSMEGRPTMPRHSLVGRNAPDNGEFLQTSLGGTLPPFANINEARLELDAYWHDLMFVLHELSEPDMFATTLSAEDFMSRCQVFQEAFVRWRIRFDSMVEDLDRRPVPMSLKERKALAQLQIYQQSGAQILETCLQPNEMNWDNFHEGFKRNLELCDIIAQEEKDASGGSVAHGGFQLDHGIVPACWHTIWKCRAARVRLHAINLLSQPRQDGLWDGQLAQLVGRHIDQIERGPETLEDAALRDAQPEEIPLHRRILGIDVMFSASGRDAVVTFFLPRSETDPDIIAIRKTLSW